MQRAVGKAVIVTGGGGGIGGGTCRRLAAEGAQLAAFDVRLEAAEQVAAVIRADGGRAEAIRCDITQRDSVDQAIGQVRAGIGAIDVLVNNAGWDVFKPFTKTEPAEWDRLIAINLVGALHMHPRRSRASMRATAPLSTSSAPARPTPRCSPTSRRPRPTPRS
jgi:2-hydroxycyclohexanecarboxyl-CoA dehydrogenase